MGESELKKALQREGEARAREYWQDAESTVEERRKEINRKLEQLRSDSERKLQADIDELRNNQLFAAHTEARKRRLMTDSALAERLYVLAEQLLPEMTRGSGEAQWQAFCAELPAAKWGTLAVHPDDCARAQKTFPGVKVESAPDTCGGLVATSSDGMVRVDNSLVCRLERAWPDLLPQLMEELHQLVEES